MTEIEAQERYLLSAVLSGDSHALDQASDIVSAEDFMLDHHRALWEALRELRDKSYSFQEPGLIYEIIRDWGKVGGIAYYGELLASTITDCYVSTYAHAVHRNGIVRRAQNNLPYLRDIMDRNSSMEDIARAAELVLGELIQDDSTQQKTFGQQLEDRVSELHSISVGDGPTWASFGFPALEEIIGGLMPGCQYVVAARPSHGKSAFALNASYHLARMGTPVLFVSLEMSEAQLCDRMLGIDSRVNVRAILKGFAGAGQVIQARHALPSLSRLPLTIAPPGEGKLHKIKSLIRRIARAHETGPRPVVVIDYLQLIQGTGGAKQQRYAEVGEVSRSLKAIALELDVSVILLAQLGRSAEGRSSCSDMLQDLRESGDIEQDADAVIILWRATQDQLEDSEHQPINGRTLLQLTVAKQRSGPLGACFVELEGPTQRIYEFNATEFQTTNKPVSVTPADDYDDGDDEPF